MMNDMDVLIERRGSVGLLTLNRPKALNALTHDMVRKIDKALTAWSTDSAVQSVVIRGAGGRAFCAGGDIRVVHDLGRAGRQDEALTFWRDEYVMNRQIKRYAKPYIALIEGIVMGGGVGVSLHGSHRVAAETFSFAMPEVGIGFFPDVGATYALPRLPWRSGLYLALTGARICRADAMALGLVTHAVNAADFDSVVERISTRNDIDSVVGAHAVDPGPAPLLQHRALIEKAFSEASLGKIIAVLEQDGSEFALGVVRTMRSKSPLSMAIALEQMHRGAALSFEEAMALEMRVVSHIVHGTEFYEGVRATIIDKDQAPRWSPSRIEDVDQEMVNEYFKPIANELIFT